MVSKAKSKKIAGTPVAAPAPAIASSNRYLPWLAVGYASFFFLISYFANPARPGAFSPLGWYDQRYSYDQWQYYSMAVAIPHGSLGPFQYPVVYPFFGYLGRLFYSPDPFFLPDLILFAVFVYFSFRAFSLVLRNTLLTLAAAAVLIHASCPMFVKPWTTTVTAAAVAVILYVYFARRASGIWGAICGLCLVLSFGARVADLIPVGAVFGLILLDFLRQKTGLRFSLAAALTALPLLALILAVNHKFTGLWLGYYYTAAAGQSWCFACIPWKLYGYAIDAYRFQGAADALATPLLQVIPLLLLAPLGLIFFFLDSGKRRVAYAFASVLAGWLVVYGPFHAVTGPTLQNGSAHYAKLLLPALVCCSFWTLSVAVQPGKAQRKAALWYACVVGLALLGLAAISPHKIDLSGVHVSANVNPGAVWQAIDNNPYTRWDSGAPQRVGMEYNIDFEKTILLNRIDLDAARSPGDYPRNLSIQISLDGKNWSEPMTYQGTGGGSPARYYFSPSRVRQLRLVLKGNDPAAYWSIYELTAYGW